MKKDLLYPIRKLHGLIYESYEDLSYYKYLNPHIRLRKHPVVYLVLTPEHENAGDLAILMSEYNFLKGLGYNEDSIREITVTEYCRYRKVLLKSVKKNFISSRHGVANPCFVFTGGGNMGNVWKWEENCRRQAINDLKDCRKIIFPQSIYYTDDADGQRMKNESIAVYNNQSNLSIIARDEISYKLMKELYPNTRILLAPDMVLSLASKRYAEQRKNVLLCMRKDIEKIVNEDVVDVIINILNKKNLYYANTDMIVDTTVTKENRFNIVNDKLKEFAGAKLVITDRLHGMVFSAITETPCLVMNNNNHKIYGTYQWIKHLPYIRYLEKISDIEKNIDELLSMNDCKFDNTPFISEYDKIKMEINKYNQTKV